VRVEELRAVSSFGRWFTVLNHARTFRDGREAKGLVRSQSLLKKAAAAVIEPLEGRQLLSAGEPIGSTTLTTVGEIDRGGYVVKLSDQSLVQVGITQVNSENVFAFTRFLANGSLVGSRTVALPTTALGYTLGTVSAAAVTADDRIMVVGSAFDQDFNVEFMVARFLSNGDLDDQTGPPGAWDVDGVAFTDFSAPTSPNQSQAQAVAIQTDGKILVAGDLFRTALPTFVVARYNTDGSLDTTFGTSVDPQNPALRSGFSANPFFVSNANPDETSVDALRTMAIQADGRILLGGSSWIPDQALPDPEFAIQRYNSDGSLDDGSTSDVSPNDQFGTNGKGHITTKLATGDAIFALAVDADGTILASGTAGIFNGQVPQPAIARYTAGGTLDGSFNGVGYTIIPQGTPNSGGFILAGEFSDLEIQADGKIVVGASLDFCFAADFASCDPEAPPKAALSAARFNTDGSLDSSFSSDGFVIGDLMDDQHFDHPVSIAIQTDLTTNVQSLAVSGTVGVLFSGPRQFSLARYKLEVTAGGTGSSSPFVPNLSGPTTANEGQQVPFTASVTGGGGGGGSSITFNKSQRRAEGAAGNGGTTDYTWTVLKNGSEYDSGGGTITSGSSANFSFTPDDNGNYHVTFSVVGGSGPAEADVVVSNVPPSVSISGPSSGVVDFAQSYTSQVTDPGSAEGHTHAWTVTRGGNLYASGSSANFSFTPDTAGSYVVSVTVTDKDSGSGVSNVITNTIANSGVVDDGDGDPVLQVGGSGGSNNIRINPGGSITTDGQTSSHSGFTYIVVKGGAGNDDIKVHPNVTSTVIVFGGPGDDSIKGGAGHDIIVGGAGADLIHGSEGRDILIGGDGADRIMGNADEDILVAGFTSHDSNIKALQGIQSEWIMDCDSSRCDYGQRSASILNRIVIIDGHIYHPAPTIEEDPISLLHRNNEDFFFTPDGPDATVFDDGDADVLTGNQGQDLFLFNNDGEVDDVVTDLSASEDIDWLNEP
jgi:uncharacterized delta-60 repeat protein